jgi:hypothetical protein
VPGFDFRADVGQPAELSRSSRRGRRTRGEFAGFWELRKAGLPHAATNGIVQQCGFISAVFLNKMCAAFGETPFRDSRGRRRLRQQSTRGNAETARILPKLLPQGLV